MSGKVRERLRQRKLEADLTKGFADYIRNRFNVMPTAVDINIDLKMKETTSGLEWEFKGIGHCAAFFINGDGQTKFFIRLGYNLKRGLGKSISDNLHTKNEIDRNSRYLGRPVRICKDGSYITACRLKNPKQEPKKNLYDHIFGYLMAKPLAQIHPKLA